MAGNKSRWVSLHSTHPTSYITPPTEASATQAEVDADGGVHIGRIEIPTELSEEQITRAIVAIEDWEASHRSPVSLIAVLYPLLTSAPSLHQSKPQLRE